MKIIDNQTIVVSNETELKQILEETNDYTYIYFDNNITLTKGINININKQNIVIDGTYNDVEYSLEDKKSTSASDTIKANENLNLIVIKNMNIIGHNYYGIVYVPEETKYKNVVVEYNKITYVGPQISFHPRGLTRFINVNITIQDDYITGNEIAECNKIEIGGTSIFLHYSKSNSAFWFRNAAPSLTILENATISFKSFNRELFYGSNDLLFTVSKNALFDMVSHNGMAYGTFGTGITLIDENASLIIKQTNSNGSYSTWYVYNTITLNNNSTLKIINDYDNITTSNYNIYFNSANSGLYLNNPKRVIIYNKVANIFYTSQTIPFKFLYNRINLFTNLINIEENITKETLPTYSWYKNQYLSLVEGTFNNTKTTINSNNYTEEELTLLPSLNNFIFSNKKIFSIGDFPFNVNPTTDTDLKITGLTSPNSSILLEYNETATVITSDSEGKYTYDLENTLPIGTKITFNAKYFNEPIYHTKIIEIVYPGELIVESATEYITFDLNPFEQNNYLVCPKKEPLIINITDSRIASSDWKLYISIIHDLESTNKDSLKDSLVFLKDNELITLSTTPLLIYTGTNNLGETKTTTITFNEEEGILLKLLEPLKNNVEYKTTINYYIEE